MRFGHRESISLHPFAPPALPGFNATMGALTPERPALRLCEHEHRLCYRSGLPVSWNQPSHHSVSNHLSLPRGFRSGFFPPGLPREVCASHPLPQDLGVLGFALNSQARHNDRPNRVCQTATDWRFSSCCSPPRLAATQLRSDTRFRPNLGEDFHPSD